jgi:hypothetical protein
MRAAVGAAIALVTAVPSYYLAATLIALAVLVVVLSPRTWRVRLPALAAAVPLAVVGVAAFVVGGFK